MTRKIFKTTAASTALLVFGASAAFAGMPDNFAAIDANADGQVTYTEYAKAAKGMSKTAAAQQFIKISNGNQFFTEGDLMTAIAMQGQPDWGVTNQVGVPTSEPNTAVLSNTATTDVPRWSDGTPVDLDAIDTTTETVVTTTTDSYVSETSGAYSEPSATTTTTVTTDGEVLTDITSTENPQMKVWDENASGAYSDPSTTVTTETDVTITPSPEDTVQSGVKSDTEDAMDAMEMKKEHLEDMKSDMHTTVEEPGIEVEVASQPEK